MEIALEKRVTVRFFRVRKSHQSSPTFEVALQNVFSSADKAFERERHAVGQIYRLERLRQEGSFFDGEIVRKQTEGIPPEANDAGLSKLSVSEGGGLGHCIAFRYSSAVQVLAIQYDNRAVSINRLIDYLIQCDASYDYTAEPLIREDAWQKYNRGLPTKFEIEIAQPRSLEEVEGPVGSLIGSAKTLAEMVSGPVIAIEIKMGKRKGALVKEPITKLLQHFSNLSSEETDIRRLSATSASEDGSEAINFLQEFLKEARSITVPEGDPEGDFTARCKWIGACFNTHFDYIKKVYGGSNVEEH